MNKCEFRGYTPALVFLSLKWKIAAVLQVFLIHLI